MFAFNRVFILLHCYCHLCGTVWGMRQLMDYYFVLNKGFSAEERQNAFYWCRKLGMGRFVGAAMYGMKEVFGLEDKYVERLASNGDKSLHRDVSLLIKSVIYIS